MEKLKALKEAIARLKRFRTEEVTISACVDDLTLVIDLAEQVVAMEGKMPAKKPILDSKDRIEEANCGFNEAISLCTLAFVGSNLIRKKDILDSLTKVIQHSGTCECNCSADIVDLMKELKDEE